MSIPTGSPSISSAATPRAKRGLIWILAVLLACVFAGCGGEDGKTLNAEDISACIAIDEGPVTDRPTGDDDFNDAFFPEQAKAANRDGGGYFGAWSSKNSAPGGISQPAHADFLFFADKAAADRATEAMHKAAREQDNPEVADKHGNLVIVYGAAPNNRQRAYVGRCLDKAGAAEGTTVALVDLEAKAARLARDDKAAADAKKLAATAPTSQTEQLTSLLTECIPSKIPYEHSDRETTGGIDSFEGPLAEFYGERASFGDTTDTHHFDIAFFFDPAHAAAARSTLQQNLRDQNEGEGVATVFGRAVLLSSAENAQGPTLAAIKQCYAEAEQAEKTRTGAAYSGPGGRAVSSRDEAFDGFPAG